MTEDSMSSSGFARPKRVLLTSQLRNDSFHLNRLSRLTTDANVRKQGGAGSVAKRPNSSLAGTLKVAISASKHTTSTLKKPAIFVKALAKGNTDKDDIFSRTMVRSGTSSSQIR